MVNFVSQVVKSKWMYVYNYLSLLVVLMVKYGTQIVNSVFKLLKYVMVVNFVSQVVKS